MFKDGGMVVTGVDRPLRRKRHTLHFFGQPAPLPAGHIRMALAANAELMVAVPYLNEASGMYGVEITEPFDLIRTGNPMKELVVNAERVLSILESFIKRRPHQWLMFYPVWPQFLDEVDRL
jgi:KDO2-lipid IV(A) lauroyltransferase